MAFQVIALRKMRRAAWLLKGDRAARCLANWSAGLDHSLRDQVMAMELDQLEDSVQRASQGLAARQLRNILSHLLHFLVKRTLDGWVMASRAHQMLMLQDTAHPRSEIQA